MDNIEEQEFILDGDEAEFPQEITELEVQESLDEDEEAENDLDDRVENKGNPYRAKDGKFTFSPGGKMSPADAAKNANPNFSTGTKEYTENCQKCVPTYELRRRGYDVEALPYDGDSYMFSNNLGQQKTWGADKMDYVWHEIKMVNGHPKTITKSKKSFVDSLRSFPEGARLQMNYSHGRKRIGHTIAVEIVPKSKEFPHGMMFVDPQSGVIKSGINLKDKSRLSLLRLDNKKIDPAMVNKIAKPRGSK